MFKTFFACALLALGSAAGIAADSAKPLKALLVCGGCCHDYPNQKHILSDGISQRANIEFTIVHEGADRTNRVSIYEKPEWWKGYDVIVHNECFGFVDDNKFVENIAAAQKAGVPGVMLHCSTHSYRKATTDEWRRSLGMTSFSHEKARDLEVKNVNPDHPVMKGFPNQWHDAGDELYKNDKVWPNVVALAKAYGEETKKDHICIWLNTIDNTRVFATTLGHSNASMQSNEFIELVTRGTLWACGKLDDNGKPKQGYAKQ